MKRIEITYMKDGGTKIEAFGYTGGDCMEATREIEERHGKVMDTSRKPSFFEGTEALHENVNSQL